MANAKKAQKGQWGGLRPGGGRPIKGESKRVKVAVSLPSNEVAVFDRFAKQQGISRSEAIAQAMTEFVQNHDPLLKLLAEAPEDDEPVTPEQIARIEQSRAAYERGEFSTLEEVEQELFGDSV